MFRRSFYDFTSFALLQDTVGAITCTFAVYFNKTNKKEYAVLGDLYCTITAVIALQKNECKRRRKQMSCRATEYGIYLLYTLLYLCDE